MLKTVPNNVKALWPLPVIAAVLAMVCISALPAGVAKADTQRFDRGHIDAFNVTANGGDLTLDLQEDVTGSHVRRQPESVELIVGEAAYTEETANVAEITTAGYLLPQTQRADLLWPGWDTQGVREGGFGRVDLEFLEVSGPGEVYLFQTGSFGAFQSVLDGGGAKLGSGARIVQEEPSHVHANWLFTQPGVYTMRVVAKADGVESNQAVYTWRVGDGAAATNTTAKTDNNASEPVPEAPKPEAPKQLAPQQEAPRQQPQPQPQQQAQQPQQQAPKCTATLRPMIKDDRNVPATWTRPEDLVFGLGQAAEVDLPQAVGPVPAGKAWMIGATQQDNVPWLGANTQHESLIANTTGEVTWEVTGFDGPGSMVVFTQGGLGQVVGEQWFAASNGKPEGRHTIPANSHVHPNWVFSASGSYRVKIRQTATTKAGETVSGEAVLTFNVGPPGNADSGHFDFGSVFDPEGSCAAAAGQNNGGNNGNSAETRPDALAETGTTVMTVPFAILGLGILVFGGGMVCLDSALRRRLLGTFGAGQ